MNLIDAPRHSIHMQKNNFCGMWEAEKWNTLSVSTEIKSTQIFFASFSSSSVKLQWVIQLLKNLNVLKISTNSGNGSRYEPSFDFWASDSIYTLLKL